MRQTKVSPTDIDADTWFYDEPRGVLVVHRVIREGSYVQTDQILLSWRTLRAALARWDKRKTPRRG